MNRLEIGQVVIGTVRSIKPYGVFIDIGGVTGLLHVSEIFDAYIDSPHNVFNVNDEVRAKIIELDAERGRISLSIRQLERQLEGEDPPAQSSVKKPKAPSDGSGGFEARAEVEGQAYSTVP